MKVTMYLAVDADDSWNAGGTSEAGELVIEAWNLDDNLEGEIKYYKFVVDVPTLPFFKEVIDLGKL